MQIVVETAGEETEQTDVLELIRDHWKKVGVSLFIKPSQREVFYNRINSGDDADGGLVGAGERDAEACDEPGRVRAALARPVPMAGLGPLGADERADGRGAGPRLGQGADGAEGRVGQEPAIPRRRRPPGTRSCRSGPTRCSPSASSPASSSSSIVSNKLQNVPERGTYNFDPGAYFGIYRPDTFWLAE